MRTAILHLFSGVQGDRKADHIGAWASPCGKKVVPLEEGFQTSVKVFFHWEEGV